MNYLMVVGDTVVLSNGEQVIVGTNSDVTKDDTSRLNIKERDITVDTSEGKYKFKVVNIKLSSSICGGINIGLQIEYSQYFSKISIGDLVYS